MNKHMLREMPEKGKKLLFYQVLCTVVYIYNCCDSQMVYYCIF